jgi:DNA-binding GntR family transcriptional regulator
MPGLQETSMNIATHPAPTTLRARAYANFQEQIVAANIRPGQFISQRELMQLLAMPLGAVRELIPRLEAEGLLKTVPQRGLQIAHVDLKLINNAFQLRQLLEQEAISRFVTSVSDDELQSIEQAHLDIVRRTRSQPMSDELLTEAHVVDWGFHDRMIDALGNGLIAEIYRINSLRVRLIKLEISTLYAGHPIPAMEEHLWFIDALKRRDEAAAASRLHHHIDSAHRRVLGLPPHPQVMAQQEAE